MSERVFAGPRPRRRRGFTIIEILIAIVVLVLGITGILALFPTAIDSGNKTVEDSYSAAIAQSVVDAVAVGLRESRYTYSVASEPNDVYTYFIFDHDGVLDPTPTQPELLDGTDQMWTQDYCVILPRSEAPDPNKVSADEPVWVYPVPNNGTAFAGADPDQRNPSKLVGGSKSLVDNYAATFFAYTTVDDTRALWVSRTYPLGRYREGVPDVPAGMEREIRLEYRGEDLVDPSVLSTTTEAEMISVDPYTSYSFVMAFKRARVDTDAPRGQITDADAFSSSLYELRVLVFKNFDTAWPGNNVPSGGVPTGALPVVPKTNVPIKQFITLISI